MDHLELRQGGEDVVQPSHQREVVARESVALQELAVGQPRLDSAQPVHERLQALLIIPLGGVQVVQEGGPQVIHIPGHQHRQSSQLSRRKTLIRIVHHQLRRSTCAQVS